MTQYRLLSVLLGVLVSVAACSSGSSPTAPSPGTGGTPPAAATGSLSGTITSAATGPISGATVRIGDGPNAGRTANTDGSGRYEFTGLQTSGFTIEVTAPGHDGSSRGITVAPGALSVTASFTLLPSALWSRSGTGDTVFDMPAYVTRIRVIGTYTRNSSNFVVWVGGRLMVNELLGTFWGATRYDGTLLISGGATVEVKLSSGVEWSITEVR